LDLFGPPEGNPWEVVGLINGASGGIGGVVENDRDWGDRWECLGMFWVWKDWRWVFKIVLQVLSVRCLRIFRWFCRSNGSVGRKPGKEWSVAVNCSELTIGPLFVVLGRWNGAKRVIDGENSLKDEGFMWRWGFMRDFVAANCELFGKK